MTKTSEEIVESTHPVSADLSFIENHLSDISDRDYQLRVWHRAEGPEVDWYEESMLTFDTRIDYFESLLRKGKTSLKPEQVKA